MPATIEWVGQERGQLRLLDQTRLPNETCVLTCVDAADVWHAIHRLSVRGAPAIGVAAAYGVCLGAQEPDDGESRARLHAAREACDSLATSRPTAVNLFWALDRMRAVIDRAEDAHDESRLLEMLLAEAKSIHEEDRQLCAAIGRHGADRLSSLPVSAGVLTHCNTGALATGGEGTAFAVLLEMHRRGREPRVFADETRPLLQGARLTMWELIEHGIDATLLCDSMAAEVMRSGRVQCVITGADRIAANGDAANKIGTYGLAVLAKHHGLSFYIAAPSTTFDLSIDSGEAIPIEERIAEEITHPNRAEKSIAPEDAAVFNPAFDVTPAELITAIITERGVIEPVGAENVARVLKS